MLNDRTYKVVYGGGLSTPSDFDFDGAEAVTRSAGMIGRSERGAEREEGSNNTTLGTVVPTVVTYLWRGEDETKGREGDILSSA